LHLGAVGGEQEQHARVGPEAVHFVEQVLDPGRR